MTELLELKQRLKMIYSKYDIYFIPVIRFVFALVSFLLINGQLGFMAKISSPMISFLLAVLCAFLPVNMTAVFGALLICAHAYAISLEVFAMAAGLLVVMYALYFRVSSQYGYVLILTPVLFVLKIPYVLPLVMGLIAGPVCAVPIACGTMMYNLMYYMKNNENMLANPESGEVASRLTYLVDNVLNNKSVLLTILVFAVTLFIVYVIRRMSVDYAWYIAIGTGAVVNIVLSLVGSLVLKTSVSILGLVLGTLVCALIAVVVEFLVFGVDYSRTEYAQFEDDEYYYYVKAVPKMTISVPEKKVKKINSRKKASRKNGSRSRR